MCTPVSCVNVAQGQAQMIRTCCRQMPRTTVGWTPITGTIRSIKARICMHSIFSQPAMHHTAHCHRENLRQTLVQGQMLSDIACCRAMVCICTTWALCNVAGAEPG